MESGPKTTAATGCAARKKQCGAGGRESSGFIVVFVLYLFLFSKPGTQDFSIAITSVQGGRHGLQVPEKRLEREAGQGDVARGPALGCS